MAHYSLQINPFRKGTRLRTRKIRHFFFLFVLAWTCGTAHSAQVTLAWDPNIETDLVGYRIYVGYQSRAYSWNIDAGNNTQAMLGSLIEGTTYFISLTAYNRTGLESGFSNEVMYTPAGFAYNLSITRTGNGGGSVSSDPAGSSFSPGTLVTLTAAPASGSFFSGWGGACSDTATVCTVIMNGNRSVTADFTPQTFTLTASSGSNGRISPSGNWTVPNGAGATFTITPNAGYRIADVQVDGASVGAVSGYTFSAVSASHTITARFAKQTNYGAYALTVNKNGDGTGIISQSPSGQNFTLGTVVTLNAAPASDSTFAGWSGVCKGTVPTCIVVMNAQKSATATFTHKTYSLTASAGMNGAISPSGTLAVPRGASRTFIITAAVGFRITNVRVDRVSVGPVTSYTFDDINADHSIEVFFLPQSNNPVNYALLISQNGTGKGTVMTNPNGSNYLKGTPVTVTAVPDPDSTFAGWSGTCSGTDPECTVILNTDIFLTATFNAVSSTSFKVYLPAIGY